MFTVTVRLPLKPDSGVNTSFPSTAFADAMNFSLALSIAIVAGFRLDPRVGTYSSILGIFVVESPITVTGATVVTLIFGTTGATGSGITGATTGEGVGLGEGVGVTTASAVRADVEDEGSEVPTALVAVTVNVYVVPSARPVMVQVVFEVVHVAPPVSVTV